MRLVSSQSWIAWGICLWLVSPTIAQDSTQDSRAKMETGALQKARIELNDVFKLRWNGDHLEIDQDHWIAAAGKTKVRDPYARMFDRGRYPKSAKYVSALFSAVATKLGARNSGMSSSGNRMTRSMTNGEVNATLTVTNTGCAMEFVESDKPGRTMSLRINEKGKFNIMILGGKEMLVIDQVEDGTIRVMFDAGNGPKALHGKTFRALARSDGDLLSKELGQIMDHFGIAKPMLPHDEIVQKSVRARLELLHGMDATKSFNELVDQFGSSEFSVREAASTKINEKYDLYLSLISQKLKQPDVTPEVKMRLNKIVRSNARANQISDVIRGFELLDSPEYLVGLGLESQGSANTDSNLATYVGTRLKELTGQDFGNDLDAWEKWIKANPAKTEKND